MRTPRQITILMNSHPLRSTFEMSLGGKERLHNPVNGGIKKGKTTEGSVQVLSDDLRCFWTRPGHSVQGWVSPERMA